MIINLKHFEDEITVESYEDNPQMIEITIGEESYCGGVKELFQVFNMLENLRLAEQKQEE